MPIPRKFRRTFEVKSISYPTGGSGGSYTPWQSLSKFDYASQIGPLGDNPTISIGLGFIRGNITKGRVVVGTEDSGEFNAIDGHPLTKLLRRPNPWDSWGAILGGTSDCIKVDGNAYWIKARDGMGVRELYWAPNHTIEVVEESDPAVIQSKGRIRGYWYADGGFRRWYDPKDIVHFRNGRDPVRIYMGLSDLKRQLRNATSISAAERYTTHTLLNAHAGKVVSPREGEIEWDDAQGIATARAMERQTSEENVGRFAKSNYPIQIDDLGFGPESMMLDRITDRPESYLLAALGLNAMTLNLPSSKDLSTYANKGEARREAWENGIIPVQDLIAEELTQQLLPDFPDMPAPKPKAITQKVYDAETGEAIEDDADPDGDAPDASETDTELCCWWDRRDIEALREDANERVARAAGLRPGATIATLNEVRAMVDLPPVEGGDASPVDEQNEADAKAAEIAQAELNAAGLNGPADQDTGDTADE